MSIEVKQLKFTNNAERFESINFVWLTFEWHISKALNLCISQNSKAVFIREGCGLQRKRQACENANCNQCKRSSVFTQLHLNVLCSESIASYRVMFSVGKPKYSERINIAEHPSPKHQIMCTVGVCSRLKER
jgi:hypothetical protein